MGHSLSNIVLLGAGTTAAVTGISGSVTNRKQRARMAFGFLSRSLFHNLAIDDRSFDFNVLEFVWRDCQRIIGHDDQIC